MSKKLGTLVKEARTEKGLTQAALAKKVKDLTASDISKIERGEKEPEQTQIRELAAALGVTQTVLKGALSKTSSAKKKTESKTKKAEKTSSAGSALKLTAAEKKLVQAYRKADADTRKAALSLLDGSATAMDLLAGFIRAKAGAVSGAGQTSGLQDLLGSLLGSISGQ